LLEDNHPARLVYVYSTNDVELAIMKNLKAVGYSK
jgi:hypothetical protein